MAAREINGSKKETNRIIEQAGINEDLRQKGSSVIGPGRRGEDQTKWHWQVH